MKVYSCQSMKKIEENANKGGMSYIEMMENAGKACYERLMKTVLSGEKKKVCILCGKGKNGGDGFVIARYLKKADVPVCVVLTEGQPKAEEAIEMMQKADGVEIFDIQKQADVAIDKIAESDILIDCIFGIGFKGQVQGLTAELIENINHLKKQVVAIDIPSGLEGDSPLAGETVLKANYTFAISCLKPAHAMKPARFFCGKTSVVDIGFSADCYEKDVAPEFEIASRKFVKDNLVKRTAESNKGTYGKLLCVVGSKNMQGAAVLCTNAAVKSGAGIVISAFPEKAYSAIAPKVTEALMMPLKDDKAGRISFDAESAVMNVLKNCTACVVGCGLSNIEATKRIVTTVVRNAKCPVVIDADGINAVASNINILKSASVQLVLTPHPGEMSRLTGKSIDEIQSDRLGIAKKFARDYGVTLVLKGNNSVIALPDGTAFVNITGNGGMAKGGSGDVLAGIIGAFLAQGMDANTSAVCGAFIHGMCGDEVAKEYSKIGMTPTMMIDHLPKLFSKFE
ncbi:MAG: NAD(P)H-hydrate dehydratase [Clostridia bacterium]|nr:NAD(P)H-hydrate dehydratase [Clostridia bacterium]